VLGIRTKILISSQEGLEEEYLRTAAGGKDATSRVIFLCRRFGSDCFLEGASGAQFMDTGALEAMRLSLEFHNYQHPRYRQLYTPFVPYLSVIDLLFNHGLESLDILSGRKVVWSL
jgi:WbqC-like protein family